MSCFSVEKSIWSLLGFTLVLGGLSCRGSDTSQGQFDHIVLEVHARPEEGSFSPKDTVTVNIQIPYSMELLEDNAIEALPGDASGITATPAGGFTQVPDNQVTGGSNATATPPPSDTSNETNEAPAPATSPVKVLRLDNVKLDLSSLPNRFLLEFEKPSVRQVHYGGLTLGGQTKDSKFEATSGTKTVKGHLGRIERQGDSVLVQPTVAEGGLDPDFGAHPSRERTAFVRVSFDFKVDDPGAVEGLVTGSTGTGEERVPVGGGTVVVDDAPAPNSAAARSTDADKKVLGSQPNALSPSTATSTPAK